MCNYSSVRQHGRYPVAAINSLLKQNIPGTHVQFCEIVVTVHPKGYIVTFVSLYEASYLSGVLGQRSRFASIFTSLVVLVQALLTPAMIRSLRG